MSLDKNVTLKQAQVRRVVSTVLYMYNERSSLVSV